MGDNIWLIDRDAVRTPMQWTPDRNAGLLDGRPGQALPARHPVLVYHYNNVNVEAQMATSASLLHWIRGMIQVRSRHPVFGLGDFEVVSADNDTILAFTRSMDAEGNDPAEAVLCVSNLSSRPQAATVTLPERFAGRSSWTSSAVAGFPGSPRTAA